MGIARTLNNEIIVIKWNIGRKRCIACGRKGDIGRKMVKGEKGICEKRWCRWELGAKTARYFIVSK